MIQAIQAERIEGPTPNGGAYALAYRGDDFMEIVEFDSSGNQVFRTYLERDDTLQIEPAEDDQPVRD